MFHSVSAVSARIQCSTERLVVLSFSLDLETHVLFILKDSVVAIVLSLLRVILTYERLYLTNMLKVAECYLNAA